MKPTMTVLLDYDTFLRNKILFSKLCTGLFEQYKIDTYILATTEQFRSGDLERYGIFGALVKLDGKTKSEVLGALDKPIDVLIIESGGQSGRMSKSDEQSGLR